MTSKTTSKLARDNESTTLVHDTNTQLDTPNLNDKIAEQQHSDLYESNSAEESICETTIAPAEDNHFLDKLMKNIPKENVSSHTLEHSTGFETIEEKIVSTGKSDGFQILLKKNVGELPTWAACLKECEKLGDSYRGYVHSESELDFVLNMHKEQTHSSWGTRQSPSSQKPSIRFMWKSQYVPYDGIPFLNSGCRATVMECQYGPRRKGNKLKTQYNENGDHLQPLHRLTCPARIYIKRVRKFPEFKVDICSDGSNGLRLAQERTLTALRMACLESKGEERFYVQLPLETAHEYHIDEDDVLIQEACPLLPAQINLTSTRLDPRIVEKINEFVSRGMTDIYQVKHGLIRFVENTLFMHGEVPARHNKSFFPTITDLQNSIHQALTMLQAGTLQQLPPLENFSRDLLKNERSRKRKHAEPKRITSSKATSAKTIQTNESFQIEKELIPGDAEGQVYVVAVSSSSALDLTNTSSFIPNNLVQVLTLPADATLDMNGQLVALPVMNCTSQDTTLDNSDDILPNSFGKEPMSLLPINMDDNATKYFTLDITSANQMTNSVTSNMATLPCNDVMSTTVTPIKDTSTLAHGTIFCFSHHQTSPIENVVNSLQTVKCNSVTTSIDCSTQTSNTTSSTSELTSISSL